MSEKLLTEDEIKRLEEAVVDVIARSMAAVLRDLRHYRDLCRRLVDAVGQPGDHLVDVLTEMRAALEGKR